MGAYIGLWSYTESDNGRFEVLPRFSGHLKMCAIMRWEVSDDKKEAIQAMMKPRYRQLTPFQRYQIKALLEAGNSGSNRSDRPDHPISPEFY